jgi:hypothetical protein
MGKLTAVAVKAATKPGRYQDGNGLQLFVKDSGAQFWVLRIQAGGNGHAEGRPRQSRRASQALSARSGPAGGTKSGKAGNGDDPNVPRRGDYRA